MKTLKQLQQELLDVIENIEETGRMIEYYEEELSEYESDKLSIERAIEEAQPQNLTDAQAEALNDKDTITLSFSQVCDRCEGKGWYFVNKWIGRKDCNCGITENV